MKTCTCPHEATRNGFMRTGYNSLCPFHGRPLPAVVVSVPETMPATRLPVVLQCDEIMSHCVDCGLVHAPDVGCDAVDEN